jgi:hypothetical protein
MFKTMKTSKTLEQFFEALYVIHVAGDQPWVFALE